MDGRTYVTHYSNYNDVPAQEGGYAYGTNQQANWYMVETTMVERVHVPASGYTNFGGGHQKNELFKEYMPAYAPKDYHEGYDLNYGPFYENSGPPNFHEHEDLMNNFLNKLQIGASQPTKTSNISGPNRYMPTNPNNYWPKIPTHSYHSQDTHMAQNFPGPTKYRPSSPTKYRPSGPSKYRPSSPNKYRPSDPNKYRPSSPNKYQSSPTKYRPSSPTKYRPSSPIKYRPSSPTKYRPSSPIKYRPSSPTKYWSSSPTKYRPPSPTKYRQISPTKYRHTSPTKYLQTSPTKYQPTSPTQNYPSKEGHLNRAQNLRDPNMFRSTSPIDSFPSKGPPLDTQSLSVPNKHQPSSLGSKGGLKDRVGDFSGPKKPWQSVGLPATHHPVTPPTNNTDEALSYLAESGNHSPRSDPKRAGVFDNLSPRAQPVQPEKQNTKPTFGGGIARRLFRSNTIDSQEAIKRYNGASVP